MLQKEYTRRFISTQANNALRVGTDGRLYAGAAVALAAEPEPEVLAAAVELPTRSDWEEYTKAELEEIVAERGLFVFGTGADGNVLKSDLIDALLGIQPS